MDIKLESEWLPDGEDQWGHRVNAEVYRVENVDPVIAELQAEVDSWKATAETFEDFYRKTEAECDGLLVEVERLKGFAADRWSGLIDMRVERDTLQSEMTKARELAKKAYNADCREEARVYLDQILAHQAAPAAKNLTNQSPNQCDGCQAGIPVEVNQYGTPLHRMGCEGGYPDYMACTAKLYTEEPVAWTSVNSLRFLDKRRNENHTAWRLNLSTHPLESEDIALYRHSQHPVVLPRTLSLDRKVNNINYNQGWNACIDEFERLNKIAQTKAT